MRELTIEVSNQCCLACVHCSSQSVRDYEQGDIIYLPKRKIREALDKFSDFEKVRFSGGEPFIRPGILKLFEEAKKRGKFVEVLTSGVYWGNPIPKGMMEKSKGLVDNIAFSIYGDKDDHQGITREFSLECVDQSVDRAIENRIPFSFTFVAMTLSVNGLEYVAEYTAKRASEVDYCSPKLNILRFIKQGEGREELGDYLALSQPQIGDVMRFADFLSHEFGTDINFGCSFRKSSCTAGIGKAVITARGDYLECSALKDRSSNKKFKCECNW